MLFTPWSAAGVRSRQAVALPRPVAQHLHFQGRRVGQGEPTVGQQLGDVLSVLAVGLDSPAGQRAGLRGIGQHQLLDQRLQQFPQPAVETHGLDGHRVRTRQGAEELRHLVPVLAGDLAEGDLAATTAVRANGHRVLVQVNADAPVVSKDRTCHDQSLHVGNWNQHPTRRQDTIRRRSLHGFTLVELMVVIIIIGILAGLLSVAAYNAVLAARKTRVKAEIDSMSMALQQYTTDRGEAPPCLGDRDPAKLGIGPITRKTSFSRTFRKAFPRYTPVVTMKSSHRKPIPHETANIRADSD